jgi:hypothetical protein
MKEAGYKGDTEIRIPIVKTRSRCCTQTNRRNADHNEVYARKVISRRGLGPVAGARVQGVPLPVSTSQSQGTAYKLLARYVA